VELGLDSVEIKEKFSVSTEHKKTFAFWRENGWFIFQFDCPCGKNT
jgi:hypothetical protein